MTAPATVEQFVETLQQSGLFNKEALDEYLKRHVAAGLPRDAEALLRLLVRDELLTDFQARQLLAGRKRGFIIRDRYRVLDQLGAGGMGAVYLCEDSVGKRKVALKVLPPQQAKDPVALERFRREARAVAVLNHPNIVRALDTDQDGDLNFLAMEHVEGVSLQQLIQQEGPVEAIRAANCILQAALGLEHAHRAGLVHRDIKPANLLLDKAGVIKVLDLGLARFFNDDKDNLTQEHDSTAILGTADYIAPEQAVNSHEADIRADIYSLGCTFYFLLSGEPPFHGKTVTQKLIFHQTRPPQPIRDRRPDVPKEMADVLDKMMAKTPEKRYQKPMEVAQALNRWRQKLAPPGSVVMRIAAATSMAPPDQAPTRDNRVSPTPAAGSPMPPSIKGFSREAVREQAIRRIAQVRGALNTRRRRIVAGVVVALGLLVILAVLLMGGSSPPSTAATTANSGGPRSGDDSAAALERGLKDHWKMDEGNGDIAYTAVRNGSHLHLEGDRAWEARGRQGGAVRLNGRNSWLNVMNPNYDLGNTFTIAAWINLAGDAKDLQVIMADRGAGNDKNGYIFAVNNAGGADRMLYFNTSNGKDPAGLKTAPNAVTLGQWQHVAVTVNRPESTGRLYVNGNNVTAVGCSVRPDFQTKAATQLGTLPGGGGWFNGLMDDVRVYSLPLSDNEVAALAKLPAGR